MGGGRGGGASRRLFMLFNLTERGRVQGRGPSPGRARMGRQAAVAASACTLPGGGSARARPRIYACSSAAAAAFAAFRVSASFFIAVLLSAFSSTFVARV